MLEKILFVCAWGFLLLQCVNILLNLLFKQKLPVGNDYFHSHVSVLIPARNEEVNIARLLTSLRGISGANIEILVLNDHSEDGTRSVVEACMQLDNRIRFIDGELLPPGWLGKNFACFQLARLATGKYFLFVDADVQLQAGIIHDAVCYYESQKLGLLSIFPKQRQSSIGEKVTVPVISYILYTLLPLILVRYSPFVSHAAANGQFMFFSAQTYRCIQPHKRFRGAQVEDLLIARYMKRLRYKVACLSSDNRVSCRMYHSYAEALAGFSKNIFTLFGNSTLLAFLFWLFSAFSSLAVGLWQPASLLVYIPLYVAMLSAYAMLSKQPVWLTLCLYPANMFFLLHVMIVSLISQQKKSNVWKGRNIYG